MNLDELDLPELKRLHHDLTKAIDGYKQRKRSEAITQLQAVAQEHGFKLAELMDVATARKPVAPKYAHPENPEITWSGRGRKPRWVAEALDAGQSLDDLAI